MIDILTTFFGRRIKKDVAVIPEDETHRHVPECLKAPFPGVAGYRMHIAPVGSSPPELTDLQLELLTYVTQTVNSILEREAGNLIKAGSSNDYFTLLEPEKEATARVDAAARTAHESALDNPRVHLLFFPAGAIPLAQRIRSYGFPLHRMHALEISGSSGTTTGAATIKGTIDSVLLDPSVIVEVPEDMGDSYITIFRFIVERSMARDPSQANRAQLDDLFGRLQKAHKNHNDDPGAYRELVERAAAERVVMLPVWSKNEQVLGALETASSSGNHSDAQWRQLQRKVLNNYPIKSYPYNRWVIGGAKVMDTGVLVSRIAGENKAIKKFVGPTVNDESNEWLIRAGKISPLAYLDPDHNHETNMVDRITRVANTMLN